VHRRARRRRRPVTPDAVDEAVQRYDPVGVDHQVCQHQPLLGTTERQGASSLNDLERPEAADLHAFEA
jgi:hypothetical protein